MDSNADNLHSKYDPYQWHLHFLKVAIPLYMVIFGYFVELALELVMPPGLRQLSDVVSWR